MRRSAALLLGVAGTLKGAVGDHLTLNPHAPHFMLGGIDLGDALSLFRGEPRPPSAFGLLIDHARVVSRKISECKCEIPIAFSRILSEIGLVKRSADMTRQAYFADLPDGTTLEFTERRVPTFVDRMGCQRYRIEQPKVQRCLPTEGTASGSNVLCGYVEGRGWTQITRTVQMKSAPSRHECDSRCMNASGRTMNCECACGGRNHGKGRFMCEPA